MIDESKGLNTNAPAAPVSVTGSIEGQATVNANITVEAGRMLTARLDRQDSQIMSFKGQMGGVQSKLGTGMSGDGNATKNIQPAMVNPSSGNTGRQ